MTERDFAYWLQGFFEIADVDDLTPKQRRIIQNHINLVHQDNPPTGWTLTKAVEALLPGERDYAIRKLVSSYFEHVVDPQDPDPEKAQQLHDGQTFLNSGKLVRC